MSKNILSRLFLCISLLSFCQSSLGNESRSIYAGAAERDITPEVDQYEDRNNNGVFDFGDPNKPFGFGDRVISFKMGEIIVGNGQGPAIYLYDPISASALVLEDKKTRTKIALVSADLYLFLRADVEAIRKCIDPSLNIQYVMIACNHNHMGPDTLGMSGLYDATMGDIFKILFGGEKAKSGINPVYFEWLMNAIVEMIEEAAKNLQPARLSFAKGEFDFGVHDTREPLIIDKELVVISVDALDGNPIATLVQWACHPEAVLEYNNPDPGIGLPNLSEEAKEAWGKVISAGYPGYFRQKMKELRGGVVLYFNGAIGGMITNSQRYIWDPELHPEFPITVDPSSVPETYRIPNDFRYEPIQGRELAKACYGLLKEKREIAEEVNLSFRKKEFLVRFQNRSLKLLASLGLLGYHKQELYDKEGNPDRRKSACLGGCFMPAVKVPQAKYIKTEAAIIKIGPAEMVCIPAELFPELSIGIPDDFNINSQKYFPKEAKFHPSPENYKLIYTPLKKQMKAEYKMVICLANDELGYVIPHCDFDPPHDVWIPPLTWWWICNDPAIDPHYEESNTICKDIEKYIMGNLTELLSE